MYGVYSFLEAVCRAADKERISATGTTDYRRAKSRKYQIFLDRKTISVSEIYKTFESVRRKVVRKISNK